MKNKEFFYRQYDKINWEKQEKTKLNYNIFDYIIKNLINKDKSRQIKLFDIGFGMGALFNQLKLQVKSKDLILSGCEPSKRNYGLFLKEKVKNVITYNKSFLKCKTNKKYNFITAIYVFPHFVFEDLTKIAKKIHTMLLQKGLFILVVASDKYIKKKLKNEKKLFKEVYKIKYNNKTYTEYLHYSGISYIGGVLNLNRDNRLYLDIFKNNGFKLLKQENIDNDASTIFVWEKF